MSPDSAGHTLTDISLASIASGPHPKSSLDETSPTRESSVVILLFLIFSSMYGSVDCHNAMLTSRPIASAAGLAEGPGTMAGMVWVDVNV